MQMQQNQNMNRQINPNNNLQMQRQYGYQPNQPQLNQNIMQPNQNVVPGQQLRVEPQDHVLTGP